MFQDEDRVEAVLRRVETKTKTRGQQSWESHGLSEADLMPALSISLWYGLCRPNSDLLFTEEGRHRHKSTVGPYTGK